MRRIADPLLTLFVFTIPWQNMFVLPGLGTISRLLGLATFAGCGLAVLVGHKQRRIGLFHALLLSSLLWSGLTLFWSADFTTGAQRFSTHAQIIVMSWLVFQFADTQSRVRRLIAAYVLGACVSSVGTVINYAVGSTVAGTRYVAAGFNPNDLGYLLVFALPLSWLLVGDRSTAKWLKIISVLFVPLCVLAVLLTASRGAALVGIATLLVIPWSLSSRLRVRAALVVVIGLTAYVAMVYTPETSWRRLRMTRTQIDERGFSNRGRIWQAGIEVWQGQPVLGVGLGAFPESVESLIHERKTAHNSYLQVLTEQGIIGVALFLATLLTVLGRLPRLMGIERKVAIAAFVAVTSSMLANTNELSKETWFVLTILLILSQARMRRVQMLPRLYDEVPFQSGPQFLPARSRV